jgi:predicted ester cyclase
MHTKASIRSFVRLVWNEGRLDLIDEFVAADYVGHDRSNGALTERPRGVRKTVAAWRRAFPDLHVQIHAELAEDDLVAARWTASGAHQDGPGSGRRVEWSGISVFRLLAGKQVESWTYWDGPPPLRSRRGR